MNGLQKQNLITLQASAAVKARSIISFDGKNTAKKGVGIAKFDVDSGEEITLITSGITEVTTGSAISAGDYLTADASGRAVPVNLATLLWTDSVEIVGKALEAATEEDDFILVLVHPEVLTGTFHWSNSSGYLVTEEVTEGGE